MKNCCMFLLDLKVFCFKVCAEVFSNVCSFLCHQLNKA